MGGGAFRDGGAALERATILEDENRALHEQLATLRAEVERARAELAETAADPTNVRTQLRRLQRERDELFRHNVELREAMGVVAPGRGGPTVISRLKAQLAAEREENQARRDERSAQIAALTAERDAARRELADKERSVRHREPPRVEEGARAEPPPPAPVPSNRSAYVQRLQEEREELLAEVRKLREAAARERSGTSSAPLMTRLGRLFGRR